MINNHIDTVLHRGPEFPAKSVLAALAVVANAVIDPEDFSPLKTYLSAFGNGSEMLDANRGAVRKAIEYVCLPLGVLSVALGIANDAIYGSKKQ
ncbi:MAG: hypothetical protein WCT36_00895 [Candidatus Gracilibacteria bacterium]|jgi:hypothetical protein